MKIVCSKSQRSLTADNLRFAKRFVSQNLAPILLEQLRELTRNFGLSLKCGDLLLLSGGWYVTHAGLIRLAKRSRCSGMQVQPVRQLSDQAAGRYAFGATVQLIRPHKLDPELVKAYAVDFCGTKTLREASREQVETFVRQLADGADRDRNALICQLNSYPHPKQELVA